MNFLSSRQTVSRNLEKLPSLLLICVLTCGMLTTSPARAANYTDDFSSRPSELASAAAAFTTGTAATGLSYSGSTAEFFAWGAGQIDIDAGVGVPGSFTITSRDGKAFVFNSDFRTKI